MDTISRKNLKYTLKRIVVKTPLLVSCAAALTAHYPKIFLYHRFCAPGETIWGGISQDEFAWQLARLSEKFELISFGEFLYRKQIMASTKNCAIITTDDGYRDFYQYAYPVLKHASVPATLFVTTDFIHQRIWLWPDKLKHIVHALTPAKYSFVFNGHQFLINTQNDSYRLSSWLELSGFCTQLSGSDREQFIHSLSVKMEIELPDLPGSEYAACSWDELKEMQGEGIEIGSHTVTHPVLSKIPVTDMVREVRDSKYEIERILAAPVTTFCYPNGGMLDINEDVIKAVADTGYAGAAHGNPPRIWNPYLVPRMGADDNRQEFIWRLSGMEYLVARVKQLL